MANFIKLTHHRTRKPACVNADGIVMIVQKREYTELCMSGGWTVRVEETEIQIKMEVARG